MSCTYHQCLAVYVAVFFGTSMIFPPVACLINVPNLLRVRAGKGAVFMWNTTKAIQHLEWGIKDPNSDSIATRFMYTNKLSNQLLIDGGITLTNYSGRVSFVGELTLGHAWFKITNLSVADTNMYGANIQESGQTTRTFSAVALQVTASLAFTRAPPAITTTKEGDDLKIQCSAKGPPTPQIKWFYNETILSQGHGSATLSITDIKRNQHGIYECQASNNPNEEPIKAATGVMVFYKPIIDKTASSNHTHSWKGNTLTLKCVVASGLPSPDFTWYKPNGDILPCTQCSRTVSSQVTIQTGQDMADYGLYRCSATNVVGIDQHYVNVTQLIPPGPPLNITFTDIEASSVTVRWTEPEYDGGSPVLQYNLTIDSKTIFVDAPNTQQSINGLAKNTNYEVKLSAMNMVGYGNASSKNFTTKKQGPPSLPVVVVDTHETAVTLFWSKPDENGGEITKYTIYKKAIGTDFSWSKVLDVSVTSYTVEDLDPGKEYSFLVTASNQYGESEEDDSRAKTIVVPVQTTPTNTSTPNVLGSCTNCSSSISTGYRNQNAKHATVAYVVSVLLAVSLPALLNSS